MTIDGHKHRPFSQELSLEFTLVMLQRRRARANDGASSLQKLSDGLATGNQKQDNEEKMHGLCPPNPQTRPIGTPPASKGQARAHGKGCSTRGSGKKVGQDSSRG